MLMSKNAEPRQTRPFPWKCSQCRQREVYPIEEEYLTEIVHDGRSYTVRIPSLRLYRCRNCREAVLDDDADRAISRAFREQAGLLAPEEIRRQREALGLTQKELAARLGVAESTLSRWETGAQIQQRSLDNLLRLYFELLEVRCRLSPPAQGHFRCLQPTSELRRQASRFKLTSTSQPATANGAEESPEAGTAHAGESPGAA
jgi:putative zinc finger/helix-turn-helix YgiT family protein